MSADAAAPAASMDPKPLGARVIVIVIAVVLVAHLIVGQPKGYGWGGDFSQYLTQARAIADGRMEDALAIGEARYEGSTKEVMIGPAIYPWGYPLLLAPIVKAFGIALGPVRALNLALYLLLSLAAILLANKRAPQLAVIAIGVATGVNSYAFTATSLIGSDLPFAVFGLGAIILMRRLATRSEEESSGLGEALALGLLIGAATEIRAAALALLVALPIVQLVQAILVWRIRTIGEFINAVRRRLIVLATPYAAFAAFIAAASAIFPGGFDALLYKDHFEYDGLAGFLGIVSSNALYYAALPDHYFGFGPFGGYVSTFVLAPLALAGAIACWRKEAALIAFIVVYMAMLLALPFEQGPRMLLPVMPIFFFFMLRGAIAIDNRVASLRRAAYCASILVLAATVVIGFAGAISRSRETPEGPYRPAALEAFGLIRNATPADAKIIFFKPRVLNLYTGRLGLLQLDADAAITSKATHLLLYRGPVEGALNARLAAMAAAQPEIFRAEWENGDFTLLRIERRP